MKTIGQILRETREARGLTVAQAVEGTRSKSQVIQALEQDDFSRFPAPIYARGFIKLYAEFLGLDPAELIGLYQARLPDADKVHRPPSVLRPSGSSVPPPPKVTAELKVPPRRPEPLPAVPAPELPPPAQPVAAADTAPELPFDKSGAPPPPTVSDLFTRPPAPRPVPPRPEADEFALEVKQAKPSPTARDRALSLLAEARASAGRLPWLKIFRWGGLAIGLCLVVWLALTVIRGCVNRRSAAPPPSPEAAFQLPSAPEPPPLYMPETPPRS